LIETRHVKAALKAMTVKTDRNDNDRASCPAQQSSKQLLPMSHEFTRLLLGKADMRVDKI